MTGPVEIPPGRLACPRCNGTGHLAPQLVPYVCLTTWYEVTADADLERICGRPIDRYRWHQGTRECREHELQTARLAERENATAKEAR